MCHALHLDSDESSAGGRAKARRDRVDAPSSEDKFSPAFAEVMAVNAHLHWGNDSWLAQKKSEEALERVLSRRSLLDVGLIN